MSVVNVCSACGAQDQGEDGFPRCRHFRRNQEIGYRGPMAIGPLEAFFVRRNLRPPWAFVGGTIAKVVIDVSGQPPEERHNERGDAMRLLVAKYPDGSVRLWDPEMQETLENLPVSERPELLGIVSPSYAEISEPEPV